MPTVRRLGLVFGLTLLAGVLMLFPARVAYNWFAPTEIALTGINGTIWTGSSTQAIVGGVFVRDLHWRFRPLSLLRGRLSYDVDASPAGGVLDGNFAIGFGGDIHVGATRASFPLAPIAELAGIPGLRGIGTADIERLRLRDGIVVLADGTAEVRSLVVPMISPESIGGYRVEFFTQEDGVVASVEDTDGFVDIAGRLLLGPDRSYEFLGQLAAKPQTPAALGDQMRFLGTPNARGQYELRLEGKL